MINVKNVYWMLAYAFRCLKQDEIKRLNCETFEDIYDFVSKDSLQLFQKKFPKIFNNE